MNAASDGYLKSSRGLGELESAVMKVLWSADEPRSVRHVHQALTERDLAYTTVMTVMDRLAKKGLLTRSREGRAWMYTASASREALTADALRGALGGLAPADRTAALLHFLDDASADEVHDLRAALAELEAKRRP